MLRTIAFLASIAILLAACSAPDEQTPLSKEASSKIRLAIKDSAHVYVHEGLPHQMFERDLLATESQRSDTIEIGSFRFYTPSVSATNPDLLKRILSSADSIILHEPNTYKLCGGFHPDYAIEWFGPNQKRYNALICFGCADIIYTDGKNNYSYELEKEVYKTLKDALSQYAKKRPTSAFQ